MVVVLLRDTDLEGSGPGRMHKYNPLHENQPI